jgi:hypothetical protein
LSNFLGVCQAINKFDGLFNSNDEGIMSILAKQAGIILTSSMTYNKTLLNLNMTKRVINIGVQCFKALSALELQRHAELYIKDMINVEKCRLWFVDS